MNQRGQFSADDAVDRLGYAGEGESVTPMVMTLAASSSKPTELEARNHAIKNCASVILGLASTLERYVDPVARSRATQLVDASRRMAQLLAPAARPSDPASEDVRVEDVLKLVIDRLGPQAESCSVELAIHCAGGSVVGDVAELAEALYNLASNALQASPRNSTVRITTRRSPEGDHEWTVQDTGCGIPSSILPRLGTVGVTTRTGGMGLGLALAAQAIFQHHGVLHVGSVSGGGTTMTIWLPASAKR
jgi:signal transduction histidine kinase